MAVLQIRIYKTNITDKINACKVGEILKKETSIKAWNFDLEDCDNILRIETDDQELDLTILFEGSNYEIEELF